MTIISRIDSVALSEKIADLLAVGEKEIRQSWYAALSQRWGDDAFKSWKGLDNAGDGEDLVSLFSRLLLSNADVSREDLAGFSQKIRLQAYFFSDFLLELSCLQSTLTAYLRKRNEWGEGELLDALPLIHEKSSRMLE